MLYMVFAALGYLIEFVKLLIIVRCILSWLPVGNNPIAVFIYKMTEPLLAPIREMIYRSPLGGPGMVIDISPVILFILLGGLKAVLFGFFR